MPESHYPTQAELAQQRETFVMDGAEDRPYHFLAKAHARMGRPWNLGIEHSLTGAQAVRYYPGEVERYHRMYIHEVPFQRTRNSGDREAWYEALREGRRQRTFGYVAMVERAGGDPDGEDAVRELSDLYCPGERARRRHRVRWAVDGNGFAS